MLLTRAQKTRLAKRAKAANLTMGEFVRRAADAYVPEADEQGLQVLIARVRQSAEQAASAMDQALSAVAKSRKRIADLESAHVRKKAA